MGMILKSKKVAWFPRRKRELDVVATDVLDSGRDLEADHPGFHDEIYRARRNELADITESYKIGQEIPRVKYTDQEIQTWKTIYNKLMPLYEKCACDEHVHLMPILERNCGYADNNIPQLQDIHELLRDSTGFALRPVSGLLSARNFLYGLAFRVFFCTQYIRHHSKPLYTPEPDVC